MSARVASSPWSKSRSSAIWRTRPEHTATAAAGAGASRAFGGHADLLRRQREAALGPPRGSRRPGPGRDAGRPRHACGAARLAVVRRPLRDRHESEVREHRAAGPVGLGRSALPPGGHLLRHGAGAARHATDVAELPPGLLGDAGRGAVAQHLVALVEGPLEAAQGASRSLEHGPQLQEVGHVAHGVGDLARPRSDAGANPRAGRPWAARRRASGRPGAPARAWTGPGTRRRSACRTPSRARRRRHP